LGQKLRDTLGRAPAALEEMECRHNEGLLRCGLVSTFSKIAPKGKCFMRKKATPNVFDPTTYVSYRLDFFIQLLYDFSCHERSYVIRHITGECDISSKYEDMITNYLKIPQCKVEFWDIDYSIDWLYAALFISQTEPLGNVYENVKNLIKGNNEDVDILLALRANDIIDLVMIEVKVEKPFDKSQLASKVRRLLGIFGVNGDQFPHIRPHWILASPYKSKRINTDGWPNWMIKEDGEFHWYEMRKNFPSMKVTRCDSKGIACKNGSHWILDGRKGLKLDVYLTAQERHLILKNVSLPDRVGLPLSSFAAERSAASISYSISDLITIINSISKKLKHTDDSALYELHDKLSDILHDKGAIVS